MRHAVAATVVSQVVPRHGRFATASPRVDQDMPKLRYALLGWLVWRFGMRRLRRKFP